MHIVIPNPILATQVERPSVPLVHNGPGPALNQLAGYSCEKFWNNADTDEKSLLMTLRITKV